MIKRARGQLTANVGRRDSHECTFPRQAPLCGGGYSFSLLPLLSLFFSLTLHPSFPSFLLSSFFSYIIPFLFTKLYQKYFVAKIHESLGEVHKNLLRCMSGVNTHRCRTGQTPAAGRLPPARCLLHVYHSCKLESKKMRDLSPSVVMQQTGPHLRACCSKSRAKWIKIP